MNAKPEPVSRKPDKASSGYDQNNDAYHQKPPEEMECL